MGVNYYWHHKPECSECGRDFEPLHIGKSSYGWCFSLHVMPDDNINTIKDWLNLWKKEGSSIKNEYGEKISASEMEDIVINRNPMKGKALARHSLDGGDCIGHGEGSWDYIIGDFS